MLSALGYDSMDAFVRDSVPDSIRVSAQAVSEHSIPALSESELLQRAEEIAHMNEKKRSFIGMGYWNAVVPQVVLRNILENPSWYTPYTPYQPEVAQGRLESLINFQTMASSLTGLPISNASLLDEGTAAAEAMVMAFAHHGQKRKTFVVDQGVSPQSLAVIRTRAGGFGIRLVVGDAADLVGSGETRQIGNESVKLSDLAGVLVQYPDVNGSITDYSSLVKHIKEASSGPAPLLACATDLLALAVLTPPGELGFDIALGSSARFGVPVGYGGPHAAFFSVADALKRKIPGRLVGRSKDVNGRPAYRLALQTREQHIRREKATSNICTSQALLANTAAIRGESHRDICLIPASAHGTNPASAVMAGMKVVPVKNLVDGSLDLNDLRDKAVKHKDRLGAFMITYPSTYGVFEPGVQEACKIIHDNGGQVYLDGANLNAQIGMTDPAICGGDVCHLNLHKTFAIPHGGGGPGVGPICVAEHLAPFLPSHPIIPTGGSKAIEAVASAPYGSASVLLISWAYIKMLGGQGLSDASKLALLNANYIAHRLAGHYSLKYKNDKGRVAHELLIDLAEFEKKAGLKVMDFAKRLQDYGFHPPTCSWPISTAMLIEPTESESLHEIDRFCEAMIQIRKEAEDIITGAQPRENNLIKNAPHPISVIVGEWDRPYSRETAAFPLAWLKQRKFWPTVGRVDDVYGDINLVCECPSVDELAEQAL
ncbi:glycine dehydrogenase [decarboxylating] protein, partial [Rhizoctonia solani AG-3 Rhs1AP]